MKCTCIYGLCHFYILTLNRVIVEKMIGRLAGLVSILLEDDDIYDNICFQFKGRIELPECSM